MTNERVASRQGMAAGLHKELTDAAVRRFGAGRAAALDAEIAVAAETLADVASVSLSPDAHEPDFIGWVLGGPALPPVPPNEVKS